MLAVGGRLITPVFGAPQSKIVPVLVVTLPLAPACGRVEPRRGEGGHLYLVASADASPVCLDLHCLFLLKSLLSS